MPSHSIPTSPRRLIAFLFCLSMVPALSGCVPLIVGGAAAVGASAVYDRRPYEAIANDQQIEFAAMHALLQDSQVQGQSGISVTSYNQTVLLTGRAQSSEVSQRAALLVSRLPKVKRVVDEVAIGPNLDLTRQSEDTYITSRVKLALAQVSLPDFTPLRVKVVTSDGVVYLMGLISPQEADPVTEKVRYVPGVKRVVKLFEYNEKPAA